MRLLYFLLAFTFLFFVMGYYGGINIKEEDEKFNKSCYIDEEEVFENPIDLCLDKIADPPDIRSENKEESGEPYEPCKGYDPERLEASGYIKEGKGLELCVGWVSVEFPRGFVGCENKEKLKEKFTLRRIPHYKDRRFSIKDRYEILPKGIAVQHSINVGLHYHDVIFLKDGYKIEDVLRKGKEDKHIKYIHLKDKIDLSKPSYIKVTNLYQDRYATKVCRDIYRSYLDTHPVSVTCNGFVSTIMVGGLAFFEEEEFDECDMRPIINKVFEKWREDGFSESSFCSYPGKWTCAWDREKLIKKWKEDFDRYKDIAKGFMIGIQADTYGVFCITGEYVFDIKYVKWY